MQTEFAKTLAPPYHAVIFTSQRTAHVGAGNGVVADWYAHFELRVAKGERACSGPEGHT